MTRVHWAALALLLAALACNAPAAGTAVEPTQEPAPTAEPDTPTPTDEPVPTDPPAPTDAPASTDVPAPTDAPEPSATPEPTPEEESGGFTTGDIEDPDLPALEITATGAGPILCGLGAEEGAAPSIEEAIEIAGASALCFVNYPTENGTRLTMEMGNGEFNYFAEFYVQSDIVYGPENEPRGEVLTDGAPSWFMWVHIPAWLPQNDWVVEAQLSDDESTAASYTLERETFPFITIGPGEARPNNPLLFPADLSGLGDPLENAALQFTAGEQISIAGAFYEASTSLTVALYDVDADSLALTPVAATTVTTNADGQWETGFTFGEGAEPGRYVVVVEPTAGETVTPFNGYLSLVDE